METASCQHLHFVDCKQLQFLLHICCNSAIHSPMSSLIAAWRGSNHGWWPLRRRNSQGLTGKRRDSLTENHSIMVVVVEILGKVVAVARCCFQETDSQMLWDPQGHVKEELKNLVPGSFSVVVVVVGVVLLVFTTPMPCLVREEATISNKDFKGGFISPWLLAYQP